MTVSRATYAAPLHERVASLASALSQSEYAVAQYLSDHPEEVASATALELAQATGTSNATVVRTVKSLGYAGLPELRRTLSKAMADRRDPSRVLGQRIDQTGGHSVALRVIEASSALILREGRTLDHEAWNHAVDILDGADTVYCYGADEAGSVAAIFASNHRTIGRRAVAVAETGIALARALLPLRNTDAILLVAPLRYFREIELIVSRASEIGAGVVLISEALGHALSDRVDVVLAMPQSTLGVASELVVPLVMVDALALEIAARHRDTAVANYQQLNRSREAVVGASVDLNARPADDGPVARLRRPGAPEHR